MCGFHNCYTKYSLKRRKGKIIWIEKIVRNLKKLENAFVVYTSGKAYANKTLSDHGGFTGDKNRPISQLPTIVGQGPFGITEQRAQDFITLLINTMNGAILEDNKGSVRDEARDALFQSMAYLLFDDWVAIGEDAGDTKAIHAFTLNGIQIPLSVLLMGAGEAIIQVSGYKQYFNVQFTLPTKFLYETWKDYPTRINSRGEEVPNIVQAWKDQREDAIKRTSFTTHFLSNFNKIVEKLIDKINIWFF